MGKVMVVKTFGQTLRDARTENDVSLRELAERINISPTYLSLIERGISVPPSEDVVVELESYFGFEPGELMSLSGRIPQDVLDALRRYPHLCELVRWFAADIEECENGGL